MTVCNHSLLELNSESLQPKGTLIRLAMARQNWAENNRADIWGKIFHFVHSNYTSSSKTNLPYFTKISLTVLI